MEEKSMKTLAEPMSTGGVTLPPASAGLRLARAAALAPGRINTWKASALAVSGAISLSGVAHAQSDAASGLEEVVVTGSRVVRSGYDTPTPVSVINEDEIEREAPGSLSEFVMTLPSVRGGSTATTNSGSLSNGAAGISALNLRSLGAGRTLVLFDGQRSVVSASTGEVDTNTFPQSLVKQVEVVTGGASSAYGSDAISGVVNFILDKDFTGIESAVQYGHTFEGDNDNRKVTVTGGLPFADGKGHVLVSGETYSSDGLHYTARDWSRTGFFGIVNPDKSPGAPYFLASEGIGISAYTPGGLITSGPLRGTYFGEGGSVNQLQYGAVSGQWMLGGDWEYTGSAMIGTNSLQADDERDSLFARASYMVAPRTEVFMQASHAAYEGFSYYIRPTHTGVVIQADNAFLPDSVKQQMTDLGLATFTMGTNNADMPASGSNNERGTTRYVVGANGDFGGSDLQWSWDAYYQNGITKTDELETPTFNFDRVALATDAVFDSGGNIVCRSTLTDPTNGCLPLNRFGVGVASQAALDYVMGTPRREQEFQQDVVAVNLTTNDFGGWAGNISLAMGAEWRREQITGEVDPQYESGWKYGNYKVTEGEYDVAEVYVETVIPLLERLEFNAASRYTDYSTSGGVTTWKAGLVYSPVDAFALRLTRSQDIRAPNLSELYAAGTARTNAVAIGGQSTPFVQNLQGNPAVLPEEADSLGVGVVLRPSFAPRFAASIDYYDVEIAGVIDFMSAQEVADNCFVFNVERYCDNLNYVNGALATIDLYYENLDSMRAKGVDYEASYSFDVGPGTFSVRALATNYIDNIVDDGVTAIDDAGSNTGNTPDWVYRLVADYGMGDAWTFGLTARGVSDGVVNNAYIECASNCPPSVAPYYTINDNSVDGEVYFDGYASRSFAMRGLDAEVFLHVKNLFDTDPVLVDAPSGQGAENAIGYPVTNRSLYDTLGRSFRLGMRLNF
jgi:outer membrane receptor protein involved in Fe transport